MSKVKEILKENGLDFTIEKEQLIGKDTGRITPYYGLFNSKSNECINTCKVGYYVSQNEDVLNMVLKGVSKFGDKLTVSKAGSINGGRRVFIQLQIEGVSKVGNDEVTKYITILDSNDGSTSLSVGIGDKVAHCMNQFFKFYKEGEAKFRHTATIEQKIAAIPELIEIGLDKSIRQIEQYNSFLKTPIAKGFEAKVIKNVLAFKDGEALTSRQKAIQDNLTEAIRIEKEYCGNNLWGIFNGVTRFTTHMQSVPKRDNGREESLINGTAYKKAIIAFDMCLKAA